MYSPFAPGSAHGTLQAGFVQIIEISSPGIFVYSAVSSEPLRQNSAHAGSLAKPQLLQPELTRCYSVGLRRDRQFLESSKTLPE